MGRTKQLAAETQEQQDAKNKQTLASLESRTIKMKALTLENFSALVSYLEGKPHKEVENLIYVLKKSPVVDATIIDDSKG